MFQNSLFQSGSLQQHGNYIQNKGFAAGLFKESSIRCEILPSNCSQVTENISAFPTILTHELRYLLRTIPGRASALNPTFFFREPRRWTDTKASSEDASPLLCSPLPCCKSPAPTTSAPLPNNETDAGAPSIL